MKKIIRNFLLILSFSIVFISCKKDNINNDKFNNTTKKYYIEQNTIPTKSKEHLVFVCTGGYATKYHSKPNCSGFNNCKGYIETMAEVDAQSLGKTRCKKCY